MQSRAHNSDALDAALMRRAISAAAGTRPHPNPRVGAVLLDASGVILAEAAHTGPGTPHAERLVLDAAGGAATGGTLVVTLEPCNHHGRTPPCADAVIESGIARVVVGALDPDERVSGGGVDRLRTAGVRVDVGVLADDVVELDAGYFHHRSTGRPLVTVKVAASLDGQTAAIDGTSQWITSEEARSDAHRLRAAADAIAVGAGTVLADDPRLTVRLAGYEGPQPRPVVIAGRRALAGAQVLDRHPIVYAPGPMRDLAEGIDLVEVPGTDGVDLAAALKDLGARGIVDLLVEGGATLNRSLLDAGWVDRMVIYLAGAVAGGAGLPMFAGTFDTISHLRRFSIRRVTTVGPDVKIEVATQPGGAD